ncbi:MAG: alanine--tRNA ligase [Desulfobacteraceae bacterium]|nr:alanine--tRNA ligase [Desulfobacteraceae bacterium]MBC2754733.1 alanine--tRNA ligase [Desulfobacteraceae bacterium]
MTGDEIRRKFFDYFKRQNHQIVRSSSVVPQDDPTLLFTNAGMVQFKRTFLGEEKRDYTRAVTSQKCIRAGGKHNDLENVGYTARHHTFFEMLGNFSFGDYFKEDAIRFAWDLLVNEYRLPAEKLWISVYLDDDEAYDIWHKQIGVSSDRIVRFGEKDNFWSMGDTGPCGPCSEILIDRGVELACDRDDCAVGCDCDRYLEIWNLVFMQFNRDETGKMTPLPRPSIDTGMGLERIASVVQNVPTNYDTDLFMPIMRKIESLSGRKPGDDPATDIAMKVIADHSRAGAFMVGDGVLPSNEGRGYVLRRILRRAIRYGRNISLTDPFLHETVATVFEVMQSGYPELLEDRAFITNVIKNEELRFSETLDNGLKLLNETISKMKETGETVVPGDVIFKLYDTFGFPVDIVKDVVRDSVLDLDMDEYHQAMSDQKEKSRSKVSFSNVSDAYKNFTASVEKMPEFVGYDRLSSESEIILIVVDGDAVEVAEAGQIVEIITQQTPFYAESGGQIGDAGRISAEDLLVEIEKTIKDPTGLIIHKGKVVSGNARTGALVTLTVDKAKRNATEVNHTATHLLHAALREVLGDHVRQAGSHVGPERLRFDFTHFSQVELDSLNQIEALVNDRIRDNISVSINEMSADDAFKCGAMALFEEKYGDVVRVISLDTFSKELCGGTHTDLTGNIGLFKIVSESSVASGVRRIEALTGKSAINQIQTVAKVLNDTANVLRERPENLFLRVETLLNSQKSFEKELEKLKSQIAAKSADNIEDDVRSVNGINVVAKKVAVETPAALRDLADKFRDKIKSGIVVLGTEKDAKALLIAIVTKDLLDKFHAGKIIKAVAAEVGGGGGGRPDMAQAGGSKPENLDAAIKKVFELVGG